MFPVNYGPGQSQKTQNFNGVGIAPQLLFFSVSDLAAGADIADQLLAKVPAGYSMTILQADIVSNGSAAGIDAGNTTVVDLKNGSNSIVAKTFNNTVTFPGAGAVANMGAISTTYGKIDAAGTLLVSVTNGATANPPPFVLQLLVSLDQELV